jgi:cytochrome c-type biogenesis protein CcmF
MNLGGPISHIGVGLLLIGIVGSGVFDTMTQIALNPNEPKQAFGYQFVFRGVDEQAEGGPRTHIEVTDGNTIFMSTPKLYFSEYNQAVMREPDIKIFPLKDLYISPLELRSQSPEHSHPTLELAKGESAKFGEYTIQFVRFESGNHSEAGAMAFGALLNVSVRGTTHELMPQILINQKGEQQFTPAMLPALNDGKNQQVFLAAMNVEQKKILLEMSGHEEDENAHAQTLIVEISTKPLMMVVWTGVVLILAGSAMAFKRRLAIAERSIAQ